MCFFVRKLKLKKNLPKAIDPYGSEFQAVNNKEKSNTESDKKGNYNANVIRYNLVKDKKRK